MIRDYTSHLIPVLMTLILCNALMHSSSPLTLDSVLILTVYVQLSSIKCATKWTMNTILLFSKLPTFSFNHAHSFHSSSLPLFRTQLKSPDVTMTSHKFYQYYEVLHSKQVELLFIEGAENPADLFTKNLGHIKFTKFREQLGLEIY